MLAIYLSDIRRRSCAPYTHGSFFLWHDSQYDRLSSQLLDRSLSPVCWSYLGDNHQHSRPLHIKTPVLARHNFRHAFCLHSPQTGVYPLCAGTLGSLSTTFDIAFHLRSPQTRVCLLHAEVPSWLQPPASSSVASQEFSLRPA